MITIHLHAGTVRGMQPFQVAQWLKKKHFRDTRPPTGVKINTTPYAKAECENHPGGARAFEQAVLADLMQ